MSISITNYKLLPIRRDKQIISSSGVSSGGGASSGGGGISATWGSIIGTLSLQTDLQGVLDNKLFTADLLSTILTIDGTGSGIDADKLDGQHGNYFAPIANPTFTGSGSWDTPTFYVDATNHRVGIGTTTPTHQLEIKATAATEDMFAIQSSDAAVWLAYFSSVSNYASLNLRNSSNATTVHIDTNGNSYCNNLSRP